MSNDCTYTLHSQIRADRRKKPTTINAYSRVNVEYETPKFSTTNLYANIEISLVKLFRIRVSVCVDGKHIYRLPNSIRKTYIFDFCIFVDGNLFFCFRCFHGDRNFILTFSHLENIFLFLQNQQIKKLNCSLFTRSTNLFYLLCRIVPQIDKKKPEWQKVEKLLL